MTVKKVIIVAVVAIAALAGWTALTGWTLMYSFPKTINKTFVEALNGAVQGPIQQPTPAAKSYSALLKADAFITDNNAVIVSCVISNMGKRPIRQIVVQINLLDKDGKVVTWQQGSVIRSVKEESGFSTIGNAFSQAEGPLHPAARIVFQRTFSNIGKGKSIASANVEVMDIAFADNVSGGNKHVTTENAITTIFILVILVALLLGLWSGRKRGKIQLDEALKRHDEAVKRQDEARKVWQQILDAQNETNRLLREMIERTQTKG